MNKVGWKEIIFVMVVYFSSLYIWTLPINEVPFGEPDAAAHFIFGDYMAQTDLPILKLPYFSSLRYGSVEPSNPGYLWYPPQYHTSLAIMQIIGGERVIPIYLFLAITNSLVAVSFFFLLRKLFGFWTAFLSSGLLFFSVRDYIIHIFGQWPSLLSFAFIPIILYCYYKYTNSYLDKTPNAGAKPKTIYLVFLFLLMISQFLIHPTGTVHSITYLSIYTILLIIKERKIPFDFRYGLLLVLLFIVIVFIAAPLNFKSILLRALIRAGVIKTDINSGIFNPGAAFKFSHLFHFNIYMPWYQGFPPFWYYYNTTMGGWWTFPFLLGGILFIILRRKRKDILLISYFIGLYLLLQFLYHYVTAGRYSRSLIEVAHIFFPLAAIGAVSIPSLFKSPIKKYLKLGMICLFIILVLQFNVKPAYSQIKYAYAGIGRLLPQQLEAAEWIRDNLPYNAHLFHITLRNPKVRWMWMLSYRFVATDPTGKASFRTSTYPGNGTNVTATHVIVDYNDILAMNQQSAVNQVQLWENTNMANSTLIYNKNNIKVYEID